MTDWLGFSQSEVGQKLYSDIISEGGCMNYQNFFDDMNALMYSVSNFPKEVGEL